MQLWAACACVMALAAPFVAGADPANVLSARLILPTDRYDHGVLGDAIEWGGLEMSVQDAAGGTPRKLRITLPETRVFEDIEARLADLDGDGVAEVVVVETDLALGGSLAVYGSDGKRAATAFYGQTHRWLAPAAIADFDGDGHVDVAYIDRPHLQRDLVFVRLSGDQLVEFARVPGLTNHRIGDSTITATLRQCDSDGPQVLLPNADWTRLMAATPKGVQDLGRFSKAALRAAAVCP